MFRRNCSTVKYRTLDSLHKAFAQVKYFIELKSTTVTHYLAVVLPLNCPTYDRSVANITVVTRSSVPCIIEIVQICSNCLFLDIVDDPQRAFVCEFPNRFVQD